MATVKKDNKLMALLSVWGILLVLLGHSGFEEPEVQQNLGWLHGWIYSFHMPLFFMISGYLFSLTNRSFSEIKVRRFLQKKAVRLLVPYVLLGTLLWCIKYAFAGLSHAERDFSGATFLKMFIAPGCEGSTMGYLWYVFTLFMVFAVMMLLGIMRVDMKKTGWCLSVVAAFGAMACLLPPTGWLNWSVLCRDLPFFVVGILLHRYEAGLLSILGGYLSVFMLAALSIALQCADIPGPAWTGYALRAFVGLMMSLGLCALLLRYKWTVRWLLPLAPYTYSIYLLSWFGHYVVKIALVNVLHVHWSLVVLGMFLGGLVLPLLVCRAVDGMKWAGRSRWLRIAIGY